MNLAMILNTRWTFGTFLVALALCVPHVAIADDIFVDDDAPSGGNGQAWVSAYKCLQDALAVADSGDDIHVAGGTYTPDQDEGGNVVPGDLEEAFSLATGVAVYGGYRGCPAGDCNSGDPNERDIVLYETVLSGDLLGNDGPDFTNRDDNSYHVVVGSYTDDTAILDGFTVTGGHAFGPWSPLNWGGGIFIELGSPTIRECRIEGNDANYGGGLLCTNSPAPTIENCVFVGNLASADGGGLNLSGTPTLLGCTIEQNEASSGRGGGIGVNGDGTSADIVDCDFVSNSAGIGGAGLQFTLDSTGTVSGCSFDQNIANGSPRWGGGVIVEFRATPTFENCQFTNNEASSGGGMFVQQSAAATLNGCTFSTNSADNGRGGGIAVTSDGTSADIIDCDFVSNSAGFGGAGLQFTLDSTGTVSGCSFDQNIANGSPRWGGGVIVEFGATPTFENCQFTNNEASSGGGMYVQQSASATLNDCTFSTNSVESTGGGIAVNGDGANATLSDCTLVTNTASKGGGLSIASATALLVNCTIAANETDLSPFWGGGVSIESNATPEFHNCRITGNLADAGGGIRAWNSPAWSAFNCTIAHNTATTGGGVSQDNGLVTLRNSVVYANGTAGFVVGSATADVQYCDIEGGAGEPWFGVGCKDADARFVDPDGLDDDPDTWEDNDYRLNIGSPCIDAGDNTAVPADALDLDGDGDTTAPLPFDLDENPRFVDDLDRPDTGNGTPPIVDMGAYEDQNILTPTGSLLVSSSFGDSVVIKYAETGIVEEFVSGYGGLTTPVSLAVVPGQRLHVATAWDMHLQCYDLQTGEWIDTITPPPPPGGFDALWGLTCGPDQNIYACWDQTGQVLRFDGLTGQFLDVFVEDVARPQCMTFGPDGHLYICTQSNDVLRFDGVSGAYMDTFVSDGLGGLASPKGLQFGPDANLYVTSNGTNQVLRYDGLTGDFIDVFAATAGGELASPQGLVFGLDDNLYVSSHGTDSVVRVDGVTGEFIDVFVTPGSGGLFMPRALAHLPNGDLLVTSIMGHILRYDGDNGDFLGVFAGQGSGGLDSPRGMAYGPDYHLYVASGDTDEILRYDGRTGAFRNVFVQAGSGGLSKPRGLAYGPDGNLYVASRDTMSILCYDPQTGAFLDAFTVFPSANPQDIVFHDDGYAYVSDYENDCVYRLDANTGVLFDTFISSGSGGLDQPISLAPGGDGNWYVASGVTDNVLCFSGVDGSFLHEFIPAGAGGLDNPTGLMFDPYGNLLVSSFWGNAVLRYDGLTGIFIDEYIPAGSLSLNGPQRLVWMPDFGPEGDLDYDGDVDLDDFDIFAGCMMGPGVAYPSGCDYADMEGDSDVDLGDFQVFQQAFTGSIAP